MYHRFKGFTKGIFESACLACQMDKEMSMIQNSVLELHRSFSLMWCCEMHCSNFCVRVKSPNLSEGVQVVVASNSTYKDLGNLNDG